MCIVGIVLIVSVNPQHLALLACSEASNRSYRNSLFPLKFGQCTMISLSLVTFCARVVMCLMSNV